MKRKADVNNRSRRRTANKYAVKGTNKVQKQSNKRTASPGRLYRLSSVVLTVEAPQKRRLERSGGEARVSPPCRVHVCIVQHVLDT